MVDSSTQTSISVQANNQHRKSWMDRMFRRSQTSEQISGQYDNDFTQNSDVTDYHEIGPGTTVHVVAEVHRPTRGKSQPKKTKTWDRISALYAKPFRNLKDFQRGPKGANTSSNTNTSAGYSTAEPYGTHVECGSKVVENEEDSSTYMSQIDMISDPRSSINTEKYAFTVVENEVYG